MKRKIDPDKKRKVLLSVGAKQQLYEVLGFVGDVDALQLAVDFLEKEANTSIEEIKRLLSAGVQKVNISPYATTKQQALDQLAWLIIIQGKISDIEERMEFVKRKGIDHDFLKKIISMALDISYKIFKEKSDSEKIRRITHLIDNISIKKEHLP
jgi:tryptophanyl-tRNA synthetase